MAALIGMILQVKALIYNLESLPEQVNSHSTVLISIIAAIDKKTQNYKINNISINNFNRKRALSMLNNKKALILNRKNPLINSNTSVELHYLPHPLVDYIASKICIVRSKKIMGCLLAGKLFTVDIIHQLKR